MLRNFRDTIIKHNNKVKSNFLGADFPSALKTKGNSRTQFVRRFLMRGARQRPWLFIPGGAGTRILQRYDRCKFL